MIKRAWIVTIQYSDKKIVHEVKADKPWTAITRAWQLQKIPFSKLLLYTATVKQK